MTDEVLIKSMLLELEHGFISYGNLHGEDDRGIKLISDALEKQKIPKKPKMKTTVAKQTKVWFCSCGAMFWGYKEKTPFCPHCGQALDWSEVEE